MDPAAWQKVVNLKRTIEWRGDRYVYYPNEKLTNDVIEQLNLGKAKGQETPGSKATGASTAADDKPLPAAEQRELASTIGSILYLALDRPELQYAAKCVAKNLTTGTELTRVRVERIGRFLLEYPNVEKQFPIQYADGAGRLTGYPDSDWAACATTKRSTTGIALFSSTGDT